MKSLLVIDGEKPPEELREWLTQGSTSVDAVTTHELSTYVSTEAFGVDRVVFWAGAGDPDVSTLATTYTLAEGDRTHRPDVLYVSSTRGARPPEDVAADHAFTWPDDKEKLHTILAVGNG